MHDPVQFDQLDGLGQEIGRTAAEGLDRHLDVGVTRDNHHRQIRARLSGVCEYGQSVRPRHADVDQGQVVIPRFDGAAGVPAVVSFVHVVPHLPQIIADRLPHDLFIVGQENPERVKFSHGSPPRWSSRFSVLGLKFTLSRV